MRNLRCTARSVHRSQSPGLPFTAAAWDAASDSLIYTSGPSPSSGFVELRRLQNHDAHDDRSELIATWEANSDIASDRILSLRSFSDTGSICAIFAGGDIVLVREQPLPGEEATEIVGTVDAGITAAAWSPDEELLALTTGADTLLYMTRELDNVTSVTFSSEDVKASNHVSVGWGKSETQFKGKRARALRDPTVPERIDEGVLTPTDDGGTSISWRGDGAYLAVNSILGGKRRMIRVFSREGVLDSVSEPVDFLEGSLSWRPAGNLIAGLKRFDDHAEVVFFERNGLKHGQFNLRLTPEELQTWGSHISLSWNSDSSILAVIFKDRIQLWTMGNYHYYLKQEIRTLQETHGSDGVDICWHPENPTQLVIIGHESLQQLDYVFGVASGSTVPPHDYGNVAVIDGTTLNLTPLRLANIPPPMSRHKIQLKENIIDVCFSHEDSIIAVLHEQSVSILQYEVRSKSPGSPKLERIQALLKVKTLLPRQITMSDELDAFVLAYDVEAGTDVILEIPVREEGEIKIRPAAPVNITNIFRVSNSNTVCSLRHDGQTVIEAGLAPEGAPCLPQSMPWTSAVEYRGKIIVFGTSSNGILYANDRRLARNCTSFVLTPDHLIFTTAQHLLKFVHLANVEDLEVPLDEPEKDERCRSVERGAKLVTVMPTAYSLILQMPRGNLETIYPRALVLAGIRRAIEMKDYRTAFLACRSQRVDMNILHDHAPEQFIRSVNEFIRQIKKVEHIDLFLSQLREEDVCQSMYRETLKSRASPNTVEAGGVNGTQSSANKRSKVNNICDEFLRILNPATHLQNMITANVCKSPPDLEAGLSVVAELRAKGNQTAERAAEHICFLADVNHLYDHALGLYDLELALLIGQQSQKDPREYLPYLQGLQDMQSLRRQFTIDNDLGRFGKAMLHLKSLDAFDELKAFVQKHELYRDAMDTYRYEPERLKTIMRLYADFLSSRNRFKDAGIAYEYLGDHTAASEAYRQANLWRESLSSAALIPLPAAELRSLALSLAEGLAETKEYYSAATIHIDYAHDVERAASLYCKGYFFAEALRIVALKGEPKLLESVVDAELIEGSGSMTELLADCKGQIGAQVPRLRELRVKKAEDPLAFYDGIEASDIPDNVSLAPTDTSTSAGTFMTRYTNRSGTVNTTTSRKTSKNRRREERKRARGKKGSVYEEEYLVNSIERLIERVNSIADEVSRLVEGLMRRGMRERAVAVEKAMGEVVEGCQNCINEVFQVERLQEPEMKADSDELEVRPGGAEGVLWDSLEGGWRKKQPPAVKPFPQLSLL